MSDHTVIAILVGVLALLAGGLGYGLGEQRRHRDETDTYIHQLEDRVDANAERLRAHGALIEVIAEDYDPPAEEFPAQRTRRKLPEGWAVIEGGGSLALIAVAASWLRRHWRSVATAAAATGAVASLAVAMLAHGAPPGRHPQAGRSPSPPGATQTAYTAAPTPTTRPSHTARRVLPPPPVIPTRRKPPSTSPGPPGSAAPPPPRPSPSRGPTPPRTPAPSPTPTLKCPVGVAVHLPGVGVTICV